MSFESVVIMIVTIVVAAATVAVSPSLPSKAEHLPCQALF
jgi:hypothetical protein